MAELEQALQPRPAAVNSLRARALLRRLTATPAIPMLIALVLGLYNIGFKSLWFDEAFSVAMARFPGPQLIERLINFEMSGAPYHLVLSPWLTLGETEAVVRGLSVAFGVLGVAATFFVGRRYGVAFLAALLLAVSSMFIEYEQETRQYTMVVLGSALSTLLFLRLLEQPGRLRALLYFVTAAALAYVNPLAAFVVVAHAVWFIFATRDLDRGLRLRLAALFPAIAVAWLPMVNFSINHPEKLSWMGPTTMKEIADVGTHLAGGWIPLALFGVMLLIGLRRDLPTAWLLVPLLGTLAITFTFQPVHQARYFIAILPPAAILLARNPRVLVAGALALSLLTLPTVYLERPKADWRGTAAYVASQVQPGDGIVFSPSWLRVAFGYYAHVGEPLYASAPWTRSDLVGGQPDIPKVMTYDRIWLISSNRASIPQDLQDVLSTYAVADSRDFYAGTIHAQLLVQPGTAQ